MSPLAPLEDRPLDVICLGRVAVDLYGRQLGGRLEDMQSFQMSLGGSSGNVAFGTARLGLRSSMLSRVGDEHLGRFLRDELVRVGCDVSNLHVDKARLTALVILGVRGDGTFPHIFYREKPADMAISADDFDETYIGLSQALAITGTHLSQEVPRHACHEALKAAKKFGTRCVLDIDYRPVLWGLSGHSEGEGRFVASEEVTKRLRQVLAWFDVIVGTEEELHIAGGTTDTMAALRAVRALSEALIVLKRGEAGCVIFEGAIPASLEEGVVCPPFPVVVRNTLGAGDGFMSGFLRGLLRGQDLATCGRWGNACGALVVSRQGCAPAMPSFEELEAFLARAAELPEPDNDPHIRRLHRVAERRERWGDLGVLAFDHRSQLEDLGLAPERIVRVKQIIAEGAYRGALGAGLRQPHVIVDDRYGSAVLARLSGTGSFLGRPIEIPGSRPVAFEGGIDLGLTLERWPREHVVKCLVRYSVDDDAGLRAAQEARIRTLYDACCTTGHELLLELLPPADDTFATFDVHESMARFYAVGVFPDWWKIAPPSDEDAWEQIAKVVAEHDRHCRGVLVLGLDLDAEALEVLVAKAAAARVCRGFAIGRTLWREPLERWLLDGDDVGFARDVAAGYARFVEVWRQARLQGEVPR